MSSRSARRSLPPPAEGAIRIRGARQNNLTGVDVDIPRNRLTAITGVSGSGKSSLAFDTLFREGQRRFLETLSAYARQFLGRMEKPAVDHVEGLSPAIAVDQKALSRGPRSTVGTLTEIVDHLRVLWARAGVARCPEHGTALQSQTVEAVLAQVHEVLGGQAVHVLAPLIRDRKGAHKALFADLVRKGYVRARVDGAVHRLEEVPELERYKRHTVEVVVDRLRLSDETLERLREALHIAAELGSGDLMVVAGSRAEGEELRFSTQSTCPECGFDAPPLEPRSFSFNSPHGACPECDGLGLARHPSEARCVADPTLSINDGAIALTRKSGGALLYPRVDFRFLEQVAEDHGFSLDTPWRELTRAAQRIVMFGAGEKRYTDHGSWDGERSKGSYAWKRRYRGVLPALQRAVRRGSKSRLVARYLEVGACVSCEGSRLGEFARAVELAGVRMSELCQTPVGQLGARIDALEAALDGRQSRIARELLAEVRRRLAFLVEVGLDYLSLDRSADTLSGGEAQRIRLAAQLGAGLQGVLYVLDEPSIGLHARDQGRLLGALRGLRDAGNTVVVVEHDEGTLRAADHLIDVGPGAGRDGGAIVAAGAPDEVARTDSPTGRMLRGELEPSRPSERRTGDGRMLEIYGASGFNLQGVDARFPLGALSVVTGVSGSGKSTLIASTLRRAVARQLELETPDPLPCARIDGLEHIEELVAIDAAPIGRTPRSNPATYAGAAGPIRVLFASLPESKLRGWSPGRFSFNVADGRCESCQGAGAQFVELQFLAPVTVPCEDCGGRRFQEETLSVRFKGHSIADVFDLTLAEALELFVDHPHIARPLRTLVDVGLGYLTLGQPSTTLSGGEAQRVKLAKYLQRPPRKSTLYLLDEPTTGLHAQDVGRLVQALQRLVENGGTVVVVEHDLDLVRAADHVVDLGPEGGDGGGQLVVCGTPEEIEAHKGSHTGKALRAARRARKPERRQRSLPKGLIAPPSDRLHVQGARTHNLKNISVSIPRDALTVVTGPSGSGKSSLALDTIHAAGRQRFVESLSTYARQFLSSRDRPPVDRIDGLGPSVAVEVRSASGHPRSTIATTTELHDHLRVLWARAGTRRCPTHGEKLERKDASQVARQLVKECEGQKGWITAPLWGAGRARPDDLLAALHEALPSWRQAGFARALIDGVELRLDKPDALPAELARDARVELVVDRLELCQATRARVAEAVEQAVMLADGQVAFVPRLARGAAGAPVLRSTHGACTQCAFALESELEPRHFSFNTHVGACARCDGLGVSWACDPELLLDHPERSLLNPEGSATAIGSKLARYLTKGKGYYEHLLHEVARVHRIKLERPFEKLSAAHQALLLRGEGAREQYEVDIAKQRGNFEVEQHYSAVWPGLCGHVDRWHAKAEDPGWRALLEQVMARQPCLDCDGERLAPAPRAVSLGRLRLPELLAKSVDEAGDWIERLRLPAARREAVAPVLEELSSRLDLIRRVGLGYLTLDRSMATLSGGESRRIRLSASLGSQLVGVCYVLDEPTVGLHPADIDRLTDALLALRDGGNTVLVVEHDEALMQRADHVVDLGPGAGRLGGEVVVSGSPAEVAACEASKTGKLLRGEYCWTRELGEASPGRPERVKIRGASMHNLKSAGLEAAFGELTGVCGPSGSGKSTLVLECLVPGLKGERPAGRWKRVDGAGRRVVVVDSSPLGRTPSSVPATAVGLLDPLRELYARLPEARMRGLTPACFSFNSTRGRCKACDGRGATKVEMQFLADLWLECEECSGLRYRPETLEVKLRGRSIADVLAMSVEEAAEFLEHQPKLARVLQIMRDVGLGYLGLGQSSTTLSAGEAQRVKLAAELLRARSAEPSVVVLDEPSTGLAACDVEHLMAVLSRLAARGDAVLVIEHHVGLLGACDRLIELGPAGGAAGGRVIASGTPAQLAADPESVTGPWLALDGGKSRSGGGRVVGRGSRRRRLPKSTEKEVVG